MKLAELLQGLGDLGSALAGFAAVAVVVVTARLGWPGVKDWRAKVAAERDLAREQEADIRLERQARIGGWTEGMVASFAVRVVEGQEMEVALAELRERGPSNYVLLHADGSPNRAHDLRQIVRKDGLIARAPRKEEFEALRKGREAILAGEPATV